MSEKPIDIAKAAGMCPHGNFLGTCEICRKEKPVEAEADTTEAEPFLRLQERDPFDDFLVHIDQHGSRQPPTPEERESMDQSLAVLGRLFRGTGIRWQLDGAINISLLRGDYIGVHKDVDISVEVDDLDQLDSELRKRGYGLFLAYSKDPSDPSAKRIMERVDAAEIRDAAEKDQNTRHPIIAAVDERGRLKSKEALNFIDTHIFRRVNGVPVGGSGTPLPQEWYEPIKVTYQGIELSISHPAKVAYFKLHDKRAYDRTDLELLADSGKLTPEDVDQITAVVDAEQRGRIERASEMLRPIFDRIDSAMGEEEIFQVFASDPAIGSRIMELESQFRAASKLIAQSPDRSFDAVKDRFFDLFQAQVAMSEEKDRLEQLKKQVEKKFGK